MEMKENSQKRVLLSVLGVAILVVAVVGISFAVYTTTFNSGDNSIQTGTIMVSYTEPSAGIVLENALPTDDSIGKALTQKFDFSVSTKADNALTIPYVITVTPANTGENVMTDGQIKVNLLKGVEEVVMPTLVSALTASTDRAGSKVLYSTSDVYNATGEAAKTTEYTLRMWIDKDVDASTVNGKTYTLKVNVDSAVKPLGQA